jgi:hypothetical protein
MKPQPPRTPSTLSDSVHHRLNLYALAASAAGAGALVFSQPATAEIIYTPTAVSVGPNVTVLFEAGAFGITNELGQHYSSRTVNSGVGAKGAIAGNSVSRGSKYGRMYLAYALAKGARIGPKQPFVGNPGMAFTTYQGNRWGAWQKVNEAYLGIRFSISGETHYGWARVSLNHRLGYYWAVTLTGYAYETIAGKPIIAGKTKGPDVITMQPNIAPGSLGTLALGRK